LNGLADVTATITGGAPNTVVDFFEIGRTLWDAGRAYFDG